MPFVDKAEIHIEAGNGGDGAVSFHREKFVAAGGPDGGDGGRGGDVYFAADPHLSSLLDFRRKKRYKAENGRPGGGKKCFGRKGNDLVIRVPKGTVVRETPSGRILADLSDDVPVLAARGGSGGWGNCRFATPTRQAPRFARPGLPGESRDVELELKLLADVGLCGFPNVGKSSLITAVSAARPKIADYPFTTLTPGLGVVRTGPGTGFVMADIPGLVENASSGAGLGHEFLRHIDRCRLIVHVVDLSETSGRDPAEDFQTILRELTAFSPSLSGRPMLVAGNKCDIASPGRVEAFRAYAEERGYRFFAVSAVTKQGTKELVNAVAEELRRLPPIVRYEPDPPPRPENPGRGGTRDFTIRTDEEGAYVVEADWLAADLRNVNPNDYESLRYLHRVLTKSGVTARLEQMGIREGDTVRILGVDFSYVP